MPSIYEHRLKVSADQLDELGHVNNIEYVRWMQAAAVAHSGAQGWPTSRYLDIGAVWVVRTHTIRYRRPAFKDDEIVVFTWVANFRKVFSLRKYKMVRVSDGQELVVAKTDWAFVHSATGAPRQVPEEVSSAFIVVPEDEEP